MFKRLFFFRRQSLGLRGAVMMRRNLLHPIVDLDFGDYGVSWPDMEHCKLPATDNVQRPTETMCLTMFPVIPLRADSVH